MVKTRAIERYIETTARPPTHVRDPRGATQGTTYRFSQGFTFEATWDAAAALREAYYSNVYVYACARARAQDLAALPLRIGADPDAPGDYDTKHPIAKLLGPMPGGPMPKTSARRLWAWIVTQLDICGRMGLEIAPPSRPGYEFELWPLRTQYLKPIPSQGGAGWFARFDYTTTEAKVVYSPEEVLYEWRPSADDWREPESLLAAARLDVSVAVMQDRYDYSFLVNDARPAAVVVHEEFENKAARDSWRRQFLNQHRGVENAGRVAFAEATAGGAMPKDAMFVQTVGLSQKDAEFIQRYREKVRAICVAFGVPMSRLGDASDRTYSNAGEETLNYWQDTIKPLADELAEMVNTELLPRVGDHQNVAWFETLGVRALDPPKRFPVETIPVLVQNRIITQEEAREEIGLQPDNPDLDIPLAPPAPKPIQAKENLTPGPSTVVAPESGTLKAPGGEQTGVPATGRARPLPRRGHRRPTPTTG